MQEKEAIRTLIDVAHTMQEISFKDVLETTSGYKLHSVNLQQKEGKELIETLTKSCNNFLALCNKTKRRFFGTRINEVSKAIENELVEEIKKTGLNPKILSAQGYPDIELQDKYYRVNYLEVKISSKRKLSGFRAFYYTSGKRLKMTRDIFY